MSETDAVVAIAHAYLQGVLDATPPDQRQSTDIWYGFGAHDINVYGSEYHGGDADTLRVLVYKAGDYSETVYKGESK